MNYLNIPSAFAFTMQEMSPSWIYDVIQVSFLYSGWFVTQYLNIIDASPNEKNIHLKVWLEHLTLAKSFC